MRFREDSTIANSLLQEPMGAPEDVVLEAGDVLVVPKGMRHCPVVEDGVEAEIMVVELGGTVNTGDEEGEQAATLRNEVQDARGHS